MASIRWTKGAVELRQNKDGELYLQAANEKSDKDMTFGLEQMGSLFATMKASGLNVANSALVLYGAETHESGHPKAIKAAITTKKADKETGEVKEFGHAYHGGEQLKGFKPVTYDLRLSFFKPQLWVFSTDFTPSGKGNGVARKVLDIKRVDADGKAKATTNKVTRVEAE